MQEQTNQILKDFDSNQFLYRDFVSKLKTLIIELLDSADLRCHQITERVKERHKLEGKIIKKDHKYSNIGEITDIAGIRIITYFEDEVDRIAQIIQNEFKIDSENSIDKRELELDRFGYRSLHYVISFTPNRTQLIEYSKFINLKAEIQIRTILQHSWAEIEHDIGYKGEVTIPLFAKRTFYRVAALLETADQEFVKLKNILKEYETNVGKQIETNPEKVLLDKASLESFIKVNKKLYEIDKRMADYLSVRLSENYDFIAEDLLDTLTNRGFKTIKDIEDFISSNSENLFSGFVSSINPQSKHKIVNLSHGITLYQIDGLMTNPKR